MGRNRFTTLGDARHLPHIERHRKSTLPRVTALALASYFWGMDMSTAYNDPDCDGLPDNILKCELAALTSKDKASTP